MADASGSGDGTPSLPSGPARPPRATAGQKRPRLYDSVASEVLSRPSAVARMRPAVAKPALVEPLPPLVVSPDVASHLYTVGWARSPGYPFWPCAVIDPAAASEFPAVHALYASSHLPRKALVQYFGMNAPQFEVVSAPRAPVGGAVDHVAVGDDPLREARAPVGPAFFPWGCSRQLEFEAGLRRIPSRQATLRRAFKQGILEARSVHDRGPGGDVHAVSALASIPGMRVLPPPTLTVSGGVVPGLLLEGDTQAVTTAADVVPVASVWAAASAPAAVPPLPDGRLGNDDVWGLDGATAEDEVAV